jgi:hypothetical protein
VVWPNNDFDALNCSALLTAVDCVRRPFNAVAIVVFPLRIIFFADVKMPDTKINVLLV